MKWFLDSCRRRRRNLCLLASGLLAGPDKVRIENHLAECADCRSYLNQIQTVTVLLAGWEKHFTHIEAGPAVQLRLAKAITPAGRPKSARWFTPMIILIECWQQLIWPSRRIWAGLAVAWVLLLAVNVSMQDHSHPVMAKSSPSMEMLSSLQQQEQLLKRTELLGPNETHATLPSKPFSPQPSSQRRFEVFTT